MNDGSVLVVFHDRTLGGTSRSALTAGRAWSAVGRAVRFLPLGGVHPARAEQINAIGTITSLSELSSDEAPQTVHFHHGAWSHDMRGQTHAFLEEVRRLGWGSWLLTNNVFAVDDSILRAWPGERTVGVLGEWALAQYRCGRLPGSRPAAAVVIPNGQDTTTFRPPSVQERDEARARLGIGPGERVALRVGSPHADKWSRRYVDLVRARRSGERLVLVGAPRSLVDALPTSDAVVIEDAVSDDARLRALYWAADVFAHYAHRGETFGNVITEALLCGLPVVYRARPLRDNTPWELADVAGFHYCTSDAGWLAATRQVGRGTDQVDVEAVRERYGLPAVTERLLLAQRAGSGGLSRRARSRLGAVDKVCVAARHNAPASIVKNLRVRTH